MDPFIEARGLWEDFHSSLIADIKRALAPALPARYVVRTGERSYIDYVNPQTLLPTAVPFLPDVTVRSVASATEGSRPAAAAAVAEVVPNGVVMHGLIETEHRETFLEIRELDPQRRLVTCIEVLSPTNKRFGTVGWYQYTRKRQAFLQGHANLIEIDLLRGGRRMAMEEPWPSSPYTLLLLRKEQAPCCTVWPAHFMQPLPLVSVPLLPPDADVSLALQPLVDAVYARSHYERDIDYHQALRPPLTPEESAWLEERLRQGQASS
jgi:hypothetical protein